MALRPETLHKPKHLDPIRFRGHRGGIIPMHRALNRLQLVPLNIVTSVLTFVCISALWITLLPVVCRFWTQVFSFALSRLALHAVLELPRYRFKFLQFYVPCLRMDPTFPSVRMWSLNCAITVLLFGITFLLPRSWVPVVYLGRTILLVHASALAYFALRPASFPHTPNSYIEGLITALLGLISVIPLLFALTYYIFDFGLAKKIGLTTIAMLHLVMFVPLQVLVHALVLQKSLLFMPVLYIIFGLPVDILVVIAFYSWGMTWPFRHGAS